MPKMKVSGKNVRLQLTADESHDNWTKRVSWWKWGMAAILFTMTLGIYQKVFTHYFVNYDDETYFFANRFVQNGLTRDGIKWAFTTNHACNWHPLTWISHMMDFQIFEIWFKGILGNPVMDLRFAGISPVGPHVVNVLFHLANVVLLFFVLTRMTKSMWKSAFVSALFAIHPLHVESVAWVAERKDVLSTFFWILTMWAYVRYSERAKATWYDKGFSSLFIFLGTVCLAGGVVKLGIGVLSNIVPFLTPEVGWYAGSAAGVIVGIAVTLRLTKYPIDALVQWYDKGFSSLVNFLGATGLAGGAVKLGLDQLSRRMTFITPEIGWYAGAAVGVLVGILVTRRLVKYPANALVLLFLALGLLAKPMLVSLPLVLLMLDYWPLKRVQSRDELVFSERDPSAGVSVEPVKQYTLGALILEKIPLVFVVIGSCAATYWAQNSGGAVRSFQEFPWPVRFDNAFVAYIVYLRKMFLPYDLAVLYPHQTTHIPPSEIAGCVFLLVVMTIIALLAALSVIRKVPYVGVGWLWYMVTLFPVIGIVQVGDQALADRYTYVPLLGIFFIIAWGVPELMKWIFPGPNEAGTRTAVLAIAAGIVVCACCVKTFLQLDTWQDTNTLFENAIAVTKQNYTAENNLGTVLISEQDDPAHLDKAIEHLTNAIKIKPDSEQAYDNRGVAYAQSNPPRMDDAIKDFSKALEIKADYAEAHNNLANALLMRGHTDDAIQHYQIAVKLNPDYTDALHNLGCTLGDRAQMLLSSNKPADKQQGEQLMDEAIKDIAHAVSLDERSPGTQSDLAKMQVMAGQYDEAIEHCNKAIEIAPNFPKPYEVLSVAYFKKGDFDNAWQAVHKCQDLGGQVAPGLLSELNSLKQEPPRQP